MESKSKTVLILGCQAAEVATLLCVQLQEMGYTAKCLTDEPLQSLQPDTIYLKPISDFPSDEIKENAAIYCQTEQHDEPAFAADKILDAMAEAGLIELDEQGYSQEEEELLRSRLANLGYIE